MNSFQSLLVALCALLLTSACRESTPSGPELASEVVVDSPPPDRRSEVAEAPSRRVEEDPERAPQEETEPTGQEEPEPVCSLTELIVVAVQGTPRSAMDTVFDTVGAGVTDSVDDVGVYMVHVDATSAEDRDAIIERLRDRPEVSVVQANESPDSPRVNSWFRGH